MFTFQLNSVSRGRYIAGDKITGFVKLSVNSPIQVREIKVVLRGTVETGCVIQSGERTPIVKQREEFLNICQLIFPNGPMRSSSYTFLEKTEHWFEVSIQLPTHCNVRSYKDELLPPSLEKVSDYDNNSASIYYTVEASLVKASLFSSNKSVAKKITYSPGYYEDLTSFSQPVIQCFNHIYEHKIQKLLENEGTKFENPIDCGHKHTRLFRSMFNPQYKSKNYFNLVKDVPLEVGIEIPNIFSPAFTFGTFKAHIFTPILSLKPNFILGDGMSSGLGVFSISRLKILLVERTTISVNDNYRLIEREHHLFDRRFKDSSFDIATFDKVENGFLRSIDMCGPAEVIIPPNIVPNFSICIGQVERTYELEVIMSIAADNKEVKHKFKKDIKVVDMRDWTLESRSIAEAPQKEATTEHSDDLLTAFDWLNTSDLAYYEELFKNLADVTGLGSLSLRYPVTVKQGRR